MPPPRALIVEDDADIARLIALHLGRAGFTTTIAESGDKALRLAIDTPPDCILLDIMLPGIDGLAVCRRLRGSQTTRNVPILMVTARAEEEDVVAGLELGADDYITKPFSPDVLLARVRAVMRRQHNFPGSETTASITAGPIQIDHERRQVRVCGEVVELTPIQYAVLHLLARRPGVVRTRDRIVGETHGEGVVLSSRAVDVHVVALRRRLGAAGDLIQTVRGIGYRLAEPRNPTHGA